MRNKEEQKVTIIQPYYSNIWESLGVGYTVAYAKKFFPKVDYRFFHENFDPELNIITEALDSDIVAFSCTTCTYQRGEMFASIIKNTNPDIKTVIGGWHVTVSKEYPRYMDKVVIGEGEVQFKQIIDGNSDDIYFSYFLGFEDLPWPDREVINQKRQLDYCEKNFGSRIASFASRRGCPMRCNICAEKHMSKNRIRVRNPIDTLDEIEYVDKTYNLDRIKFVDPTWNHPRSAVIEFCEEKIKRNNKLKWEAMAHCAFLDKDILELMKASGCDQINIGVESGSQKILNEINKGVTPNQIRKIFKVGKDVGLDMRAFCILGLPSESNETIEETKQLIRDIQPSVFGITILCPYPGTRFYRDEFKNVDWSEQGEYDNDIWYTKNFSNMDLKRIVRGFNREFSNVVVSHQKDNV